jgi:hypothetical protein
VHCHVLNAKPAPRLDQADGELVGNSVGSAAPRRLNIKLLQNLEGQRTGFFVQQRDGARSLSERVIAMASGYATLSGTACRRR